MSERIKDRAVSPVLKWVGGKRQLISEIEKYFPPELTGGDLEYYEPFLGGGAVLFALQPDSAVVNDANSELINLYRVIRNFPEELLSDLKKHRNEEGYFYKLRSLDRDPDAYAGLSGIERASRVIYLNKTCYNGLFRVNSRGQFNTPFGRYRNPNFTDGSRIRAVSGYLNGSDVRILNTDFEDAVKDAGADSFVYFDPPYDPVSESAYFTSYGSGGFGRNEQARLKNLCDRLDSRGAKFLLSNSATEFILSLYRDYRVEIIKAKRAVNSRADRRGSVDEILVRNY